MINLSSDSVLRRYGRISPVEQNSPQPSSDLDRLRDCISIAGIPLKKLLSKQPPQPEEIEAIWDRLLIGAKAKDKTNNKAFLNRTFHQGGIPCLLMSAIQEDVSRQTGIMLLDTPDHQCDIQFQPDKNTLFIREEVLFTKGKKIETGEDLIPEDPSKPLLKATLEYRIALSVSNDILVPHITIEKLNIQPNHPSLVYLQDSHTFREKVVMLLTWLLKKLGLQPADDFLFKNMMRNDLRPAISKSARNYLESKQFQEKAILKIQDKLLPPDHNDQHPSSFGIFPEIQDEVIKQISTKWGFLYDDASIKKYIRQNCQLKPLEEWSAETTTRRQIIAKQQQTIPTSNNLHSPVSQEPRAKPQKTAMNSPSSVKQVAQPRSNLSTHEKAVKQLSHIGYGSLWHHPSPHLSTLPLSLTHRRLALSLR